LRGYGNLEKRRTLKGDKKNMAHHNQQSHKQQQQQKTPRNRAANKGYSESADADTGVSSSYLDNSYNESLGLGAEKNFGADAPESRGSQTMATTGNKSSSSNVGSGSEQKSGSLLGTENIQMPQWVDDLASRAKGVEASVRSTIERHPFLVLAGTIAAGFAVNYFFKNRGTIMNSLSSTVSTVKDKVSGAVSKDSSATYPHTSARA
jgi:hypothetical protein